MTDLKKWKETKEKRDSKLLEHPCVIWVILSDLCCVCTWTLNFKWQRYQSGWEVSVGGVNSRGEKSGRTTSSTSSRILRGHWLHWPKETEDGSHSAPVDLLEALLGVCSGRTNEDLLEKHWGPEVNQTSQWHYDIWWRRNSLLFLGGRRELGPENLCM